LGEMPWVSRATAIWPDSYDLASDDGNVKRPLPDVCFLAVQNVCLWHKADMLVAAMNVRFRG